ncbi:MAG: thymidine phosphorylase [Nitrospira sp.]|nr:thymidine phosphorylase [Nitrospira sp.]
MRAYDIIKGKRDGGILTRDEIDFIIAGYMKGRIPDYQISALLMAIYFNGMNPQESWNLTQAMIKSGKVLDLSGIPGPKIDKHSTGGVGDKVSLILAPLASSAGVCVPMMSGRGLGHTGGTLDKLSAIEGLRVDLSEADLMDQLKRIGAAMIGQTQDLAPADRRLYALRDVTGTVDCIPLIAASIMSKKLAEGIDGLVLDIKMGSGAFMKTKSGAIRLAQEMVKIGKQAPCRVVALITDMDQPLGKAVGNALEVREALDVLKGGGPEDVRRLCVELGGWMMKLGGLERDLPFARKKLELLLDHQTAFMKFKEMVIRQGGNPAMIDHPNLLPSARYQLPVVSSQSGYVSRIQAEELGKAAMILGAGREQMDSKIDPAVGIMLEKKRGDQVSCGDVLAVIHYNNDARVNQLSKMIQEAYTITNRKPRPQPLIHGVVTQSGTKVIPIKNPKN